MASPMERPEWGGQRGLAWPRQANEYDPIGTEFAPHVTLTAEVNGFDLQEPDVTAAETIAFFMDKPHTQGPSTLRPSPH